jgi:hypothetical protein
MKMKRKRPLILVAFLMFLYIAPLVFISSYGPSAISAQQNTAKDFALGYYTDTTIYLAEGGTGDWINSQVLDFNYWFATNGDAEISLWNTTPSGVFLKGFEYSFYGYATADCELYYTGTAETETIETVTTGGSSWYNGSYYPDPANVNTLNDVYHNIGINTDAGETIYCYYLQIRYIYYPPPEWYDESWLYRQNVTVTGSDDAGTDYQVMLTVPYSSRMQTDFDDLRFTAYDGITEWDYWIETYTASTTATVWVEVRDDLGSNVVFWMYYGNDAVATASNGTNTFIFFDDFENNNLDRWDVVESCWTTTSTQKRYGTYSGYHDSDGSANRKLMYDFGEDWNTDIMVHGWIRVKDTAAYEVPVIGYNVSSPMTNHQYLMHQPANDWAHYDVIHGYQYYEEDSVIINVWDRFELGISYSTQELYPYIDRVAKTKATAYQVDGTDLTMTRIIGQAGAEANGDEHYLDDFYIRKWLISEPAFSSFGDEEPLYPPEWNTVGIAIFLFDVEWDPAFQFGYDAFFIFLGLIMIPASTMYLVKGGRKEMSMDKVFYGLIIFALGIGFLIGGILP